MTPAASWPSAGHLSWFGHILARHARVAITGGPKTGKTTLSHTVTDRPICHTDDWLEAEWSTASAAIRDHVNGVPGRLVVEGVAVPRALRKGMRIDAVVYLDQPHEPLTPGQRSMTKSVWTVLSEWRAANPDVPVYFDRGFGDDPYMVNIEDGVCVGCFSAPIHGRICERCQENNGDIGRLTRLAIELLAERDELMQDLADALEHG